MAEKDGSLKHLSFVQTGSTVAMARAEKAYGTLRTYTPGFVAPSLDKMEEQLSARAAPLLTKAQDQAALLLAFADAKVDMLFSSVGCSMGKAKELHHANMEAFRSASASYYALMGQTADYVMNKLNMEAVKESTMKKATSARASLAAAMERAKEVGSDPDAAMAAASEAWTGFATLPPVAKVLETAEPATKASVTAFTRLHDALVAAPVYKSMLERASLTLNYASGTTPYKLSAQYLWPMVQPIADPAINKVSQSKVAATMKDYWSPANVIRQ